MAHPASERFEVEFAIFIVGRDDRDAVGAFRRGVHILQDGVASLRPREGIVDRDLGATAAQLLDHDLGGRVPRVVRVLPVREAEDRDARALDLPTGRRERLLDDAGHPPRHEVVHLASRRDQLRFRLDRGRHRSHGSLGMQWPPTPAPGLSIIRYGHVLTRSRTRNASTPSSSLIKATSFAKAIWTSQYAFSAVFTTSAVVQSVAWISALTKRS